MQRFASFYLFIYFLLNGSLKLQKLTDKFLSGGMIIQYGGVEKKGGGREFAGPPESNGEYSF